MLSRTRYFRAEMTAYTLLPMDICTMYLPCQYDYLYMPVHMSHFYICIPVYIFKYACNIYSFTVSLLDTDIRHRSGYSKYFSLRSLCQKATRDSPMNIPLTRPSAVSRRVTNSCTLLRGSNFKQVVTAYEFLHEYNLSCKVEIKVYMERYLIFD